MMLYPSVKLEIGVSLRKLLIGNHIGNQVMMMLPFLNDVANDAESIQNLAEI